MVWPWSELAAIWASVVRTLLNVLVRTIKPREWRGDGVTQCDDYNLRQVQKRFSTPSSVCSSCRSRLRRSASPLVLAEIQENQMSVISKHSATFPGAHCVNHGTPWASRCSIRISCTKPSSSRFSSLSIKESLDGPSPCSHPQEEFSNTFDSKPPKMN